MNGSFLTSEMFWLGQLAVILFIVIIAWAVVQNLVVEIRSLRDHLDYRTNDLARDHKDMQREMEQLKEEVLKLRQQVQSSQHMTR